jgi:shikimate kinase
MRIFIIGPGGVGKSTAGRILAEKLGYELIDLDNEFMNRVEHIGKFIERNGYERYCYRNSELFYSLLNDSNNNTVFVLSSGFLVHEGLETLTQKHAKTLQENGVSLLLLPSKNKKEAVEIIVKRQLQRGFGLNEGNERRKFKERFTKYSQFGDIKIYSHDEPEKIAEDMKNRLATHLTV